MQVVAESKFQPKWICLIVYAYPPKCFESFETDHVTSLTSAEPAETDLLQVLRANGSGLMVYIENSLLLTRSFAHPLTHPLNKQAQPTISTCV